MVNNSVPYVRKNCSLIPVSAVFGFLIISSIYSCNLQAKNNNDNPKTDENILVMSYTKEFGKRFGVTVDSYGRPSEDIEAFVFRSFEANGKKSCALEVYLNSDVEFDYPEGEIGYRISNPEYFSKLSKWEKKDDKKYDINILLKYSRRSAFVAYNPKIKKIVYSWPIIITKYRKHRFYGLSYLELSMPICKFKTSRYNIPIKLWLRKSSVPSGNNYRKVRKLDEVDFFKYEIPEAFGEQVLKRLKK